MTLDWGDADPNHFLGRLHGLTVAINDTDCAVVMVHRAGVDVRAWDEASGEPSGPQTTFDWADIQTLYVY